MKLQFLAVYLGTSLAASSTTIEVSYITDSSLQAAPTDGACGPGLGRCSYAKRYEYQLCPMASGTKLKTEREQHIQCLCLLDLSFWDSIAACKCDGEDGQKLMLKFCGGILSEQDETIIFHMPTEFSSDMSNAITVTNSYNMTDDLLTDVDWATRIQLSELSSQLIFSTLSASVTTTSVGGAATMWVSPLLLGLALL